MFGGICSERNWWKAGVKGFKEEVALGLSVEGSAEEQSGLGASIKTGMMGKLRVSAGNWHTWFGTWGAEH